MNWRYALISIIFIAVFLAWIYYPKVGDFLISLGLLSIVGGWTLNRIDERNSNNNLKEILVEEIQENLKFLNENIWLDKESGKRWRDLIPLGLDDKRFNALISANKLSIFNTDQRRALIYLYRGVANINKVAPQSNTIFGQQHLFQDALKRTKYHIKQILEMLDKKQSYEELELKGHGHDLPGNYKSKTLEIYPD